MDFDRMKHSLAVARKMVEIGNKLELNKEQLHELFNLEEIYRVIIESYPNKNLTTIDVRSYIRYAINHRDINK